MSKNGLGCECEAFVTGGIVIRVERDPADDRLISVRTDEEMPKRTAVSKGFAERMNKATPGIVDWSANGRRLTIRADQREYAYRHRGVCSCGYIMIERE